MLSFFYSIYLLFLGESQFGVYRLCFLVHLVILVVHIKIFVNTKNRNMIAKEIHSLSKLHCDTVDRLI